MKAFIISLVCMVSLDFLWLGVLMKNFYKSEIGALMRITATGEYDVILWAAAAVYLLMPLGIVLFVLPKATESSNVWMVPVWGFVFGLILYGVYDFTNLSLLNHWTIPVTLVDMFWGATLCAITSGVSFYFTRS